MRRPNEHGNSPTPADLQEKFGDEAETYARVRSEAAAEAGDEEASGKWEQLASKLRQDETDGGQA